MLKYTAAFDGLKFSSSTLDHAIELTKITKAWLTGVFLDDPSYTSHPIYDILGTDGVEEKKLYRYRKADRLLRQQAAFKFQNHCTKEGISFITHHDEHHALQDLLQESVFSDLLIIDRHESFSHHESSKPSRFLRDLLSQITCPIMLVSGTYKPVQKIIVLYDGKPSSVFAIRQFDYIFPSLPIDDIELICIKEMNEDEHLPFHKWIMELMRRHHSKLSYRVIKGIPEKIIPDILTKEQKNIWVVLGAYRRSMISRWFRSSMADVLMNAFEYPLFIAHIK